jgi:tetratricopeptide (TPR) repeat protein
VWSADPELPIVATMFRTELSMTPLDRYESLALIAHSMGGLVAQQALLDDPLLVGRVRHLILFGTPSGGLRKASWVKMWKRQLRNMAQEGEFVTNLRRTWASSFADPAPFNLMTIAGSKDQFVPPESSLEPFARRLRYVVPGDHLSMVKPDKPEAESVRLVVSTLTRDQRQPPPESPTLRMAAEQPSTNVAPLIQQRGDTLTEPEVVEAALAYERSGKRAKAIALLERYQSLGTDVQGTLAGRIKRLWIEDEGDHYAQRALDLYQHALRQAEANHDHKQIYYHAINVAFLRFVAFGQRDAARDMAELALRHCTLSSEDVWSVATRAEAHLYKDDRKTALRLYGKVPLMLPEPWQLASTSLQAGRVALKLDDPALADELEQIFTPTARRPNKIFISYSRRDQPWVDRLRTMLQPYLREAEADLTLWIDRDGIEPGDAWFDEIQRALSDAGVAVALVSADFLASEFVTTHELPKMIEAAKQGDLRLLWVHVSFAAYEATPLIEFQAAYDVSTPLDSLPAPMQQKALKEIAIKIKEATLGATR